MTVKEKTLDNLDFVSLLLWPLCDSFSHCNLHAHLLNNEDAWTLTKHKANTKEETTMQINAVKNFF